MQLGGVGQRISCTRKKRNPSVSKLKETAFYSIGQALDSSAISLLQHPRNPTGNELDEVQSPLLRKRPVVFLGRIDQKAGTQVSQSSNLRIKYGND